MNDLDLTTAMHDRVADVHPDLDRLVTTSMRAGTRMRRRRRIGISVAAAAGVAAIAGGAALLAPGGDARTSGGGVDLASEPTASATPAAAPLVAGNDLTTPHGTRVQVELAAHFQLTGEILSEHAPSTATFALVLPDGYTDADLVWINRAYPGQLVATAAAPATGLVDHAPVDVTAKGWTCQWFLADDKAACTSAAGGAVGLVIRPAKERASWIADPDKGATTDVFTTDAHGQVFVTVQGGTAADVQQIGHSLRWLH